MNDKLIIQLPTGYRWVLLNEIKKDNSWRYADEGYWKESGHDSDYCCPMAYFYIAKSQDTLPCRGIRK